MKKLFAIFAILALAAVSAAAQGIPARYSSTNKTLYASSNGAATACTSARPCSVAQAVYFQQQGALLGHRYSIKLAAGTYTAAAVDVTAWPVSTGAALIVEGTASQATVDGHETGSCTWANGAHPARSTCTYGSAGWTSGQLVGKWLRLGAVTTQFPDGTCGTFVVQSNSGTVATLEVNDDTGGASIPSACTGSLAFEVLQQGTVITDAHAAINPANYPSFSVGLPDGGFNANVVPPEDLAPYQLGVNAIGPMGRSTVILRWLKFAPSGGASAATHNVKLGPGTDLTLDHVSLNTAWVVQGGRNVAGFGVYATGGNSILLKDSRVDRLGDASNGTAAIGTRNGVGLKSVRGLSNVALNVDWIDLRGPLHELHMSVNYLDTPFADGTGVGAYTHQGVDRANIRSDIVTDAGTMPIWFGMAYDVGEAFDLWGSPSHGSMLESTWEGAASSGQVFWGFGDHWYLDGVNTINFPSAAFIFCPDYNGDVQIQASAQVLNATKLADYSPGCTGGATKTWTQVDAGTDFSTKGLCGSASVGSPRAGCIQLNVDP